MQFFKNLQLIFFKVYLLFCFQINFFLLLLKHNYLKNMEKSETAPKKENNHFTPTKKEIFCE